MWKHGNFINLQLYADFDGNINLTSPDGIVLKTQSKYCDKDITVTPTLEAQTATPTSAEQTIEPSDGYCGLKKVTIAATPTQTKTVTPSTSAQTVTPDSGKYLSQVTVEAIPDSYIIPTGTLSITENGTKDVTNYASVQVAVPGVTEVATATAMDALLVEANVGQYYKFTGTTDTSYTNGDLYLVEG